MPLTHQEVEEIYASMQLVVMNELAVLKANILLDKSKCNFSMLMRKLEEPSNAPRK